MLFVARCMVYAALLCFAARAPLRSSSRCSCSSMAQLAVVTATPSSSMSFAYARKAHGNFRNGNFRNGNFRNGFLRAKHSQTSHAQSMHGIRSHSFNEHPLCYADRSTMRCCWQRSPLASWCAPSLLPSRTDLATWLMDGHSTLRCTPNGLSASFELRLLSQPSAMALSMLLGALCVRVKSWRAGVTMSGVRLVEILHCGFPIVRLRLRALRTSS